MNAPHTPPAPFVLPSAVAALTSRLPAFPGSVLLVTALNVGLARQLPRDVGEMLLNKRLRIQRGAATAMRSSDSSRRHTELGWLARPTTSAAS